MIDQIRYFSNKIISKSANKGDIIFIDFDDTIVDHSIIRHKVDSGEINESNSDYRLILKYSKPYSDAIESIKKLSKIYKLYILTGAKWKLPSDRWNGMDWKPTWLEIYLGKGRSNIFYNKVIYCSHKELLVPVGSYLIDNNINKLGSNEWYIKNKLINFGNNQFPDWKSIYEFLK